MRCRGSSSVLLALFILGGSAGGQAEPAKRPALTAQEQESIERTIARLTLEQKVGQLLMIGFGGRRMSPDIAKLLSSYNPGAVALYSRNISTPEQVSQLIGEIRAQTAVQPFLAIDQEGGNVIRVRAKVAVLPGTMTLGATRDPVLSFLAGQAQAVDLRVLGFDMNLAPVLDTNQNSKNPVINVRAFGEHPDLVSQLGVAFVLGQETGGLVTVAKHFPGHGATEQDSHYALPRINISAETLLETELMPFQKAIEAGLDAIMTAHIQVPALDPDGTPASLSSRVIDGLLRQKLGFDGLVITDDLEMRAITDGLPIGEAAVRSIQAGADMIMVIWTPQRKQEVFQALIQAVRQGVLSEERLMISLQRIFRLKAKAGLLDPSPARRNEIALLPNSFHQQVAQIIAARGITLVSNEEAVLPLCSGRGVLVASPLGPFLSELEHILPGVSTVPLEAVSSERHRRTELARLVELSRSHRILVVGAQNAYQAWLIQNLLPHVRIPVVVVSFGSPYLLRHFPSVDAYLCTYSFLASAQKAAAQALAGRASVTGRLPVTISETFRRGHGLTLMRTACTTASR